MSYFIEVNLSDNGGETLEVEFQEIEKSTRKLCLMKQEDK
jgi:hypothetical protein